MSADEDASTVWIKTVVRTYWKPYHIKEKSVPKEVDAMVLKAFFRPSKTIQVYEGIQAVVNETTNRVRGLVVRTKWFLYPHARDLPDALQPVVEPVVIRPLDLKRGLREWKEDRVTRLVASFTTSRTGKLGLRTMTFEGNDVVAGIHALNRNQEMNLDLRQLQPWVEIQWANGITLSCPRGVQVATIGTLGTVLEKLMQWQEERDRD